MCEIATTLLNKYSPGKKERYQCILRNLIPTLNKYSHFFWIKYIRITNKVSTKWMYVHCVSITQWFPFANGRNPMPCQWMSEIWHVAVRGVKDWEKLIKKI